MKQYKLPTNLAQILAEEGFWEDEALSPIDIIVEEIEYKGEEVISYQASFEPIEQHAEIDGDQ